MRRPRIWRIGYGRSGTIKTKTCRKGLKQVARDGGNWGLSDTATDLCRKTCTAHQYSQPRSKARSPNCKKHDATCSQQSDNNQSDNRRHSACESLSAALTTTKSNADSKTDRGAAEQSDNKTTPLTYTLHLSQANVTTTTNPTTTTTQQTTL